MDAPSFVGDFRLLHPLPVLRDEDGTYHCPSPVFSRVWNDDEGDVDEIGYEVMRVMCGEDLHVRWTLWCPVPDHDSPSDNTISAKDASEWANHASWELVCGNGHVLLTSAAPDGEWGEAPLPFDSRRVFDA